MHQDGDADQGEAGFGFDTDRVWAEPLTYEQIAAESTLGPAAFAVKIHHAFFGNNPEERTITLTPTSTGSKLFAAVLGGWLPASWASFRHRLILDRNAISWFREAYDGGHPRPGRAPDLFDMVARGPFVRMNHLLYAMEGNTRSWPTSDVVVQQLAEASSYLSKALPHVTLEPPDDTGYQAIQGILEEWAGVFAVEDQFLRSAAPLIRDRPGSEAGRVSKLKQLLKLATNTGAEQSKFMVIATVAALLGERPKGGNAAFRILKPGAPVYGTEEVWNACCDLRALRLLVSLSNFRPEEPMAFVTGDKRLVHFWAALRIDRVEPRGKQIFMPMDPHPDVFGLECETRALWDEWNEGR